MGQSHCNYQPFHYNSQNFDIIFSGGRPKRLECTLINKECHVACILEFKKTSLDFSCMCRGMDNLHMLCNFLYMWNFLTTPLSPPEFMLIKVTFHTLMTLPTWTMFLVLANFPQISTWKIWFWPTRNFHGKNDPNSPNVEECVFNLPNFYDKFQ
jgi:hypothetical protein